ncbi:transcriptional regulator AsnC [Bdellovibrio sp. qaytius]|nr:transcriptional regulator AsnC [Bdellovibrio sp. qaytius]
MSEHEYQIDDLDRKIIKELFKDARASYVDIAKKLTVSNATIHQRVNKLRLHGILKGFVPLIDEVKMGFTVSSLIGIYLKNAKDSQLVLEKLNKMPEVLEAYYTTGSYALIIKVSCLDMQKFQLFLMDKLQGIGEIQSTESFVCLSQPISRTPKIF